MHTPVEVSVHAFVCIFHCMRIFVFQVLGELKMINEVGDTCIESGDYLDAIWKYENFVVICDKFDIEPKNEILAKVYSNNARAALELLKGHSINPRYMQMYASHVIDRATRCIKLDGTEYRAQVTQYI